MNDDPVFELPNEPIACDSARLQASAWIDGELPASSALAEHLEHCSACRAHVEDLRALSARLAPLRAAEPVADLWPRIAARAHFRPGPTHRRELLVRRFAAALIGCAVTAALLEAASLLTREEPGEALVDSAHWPAALHEESTAVRELRSAPEQLLLASIDPSGKGRQR